MTKEELNNLIKEEEERSQRAIERSANCDHDVLQSIYHVYMLGFESACRKIENRLA